MDRLLEMDPESACPTYPYDLNIPSANVFLLCSTHGAMMNGGLRYFFEVEHPGDPPYDLISNVYRQVGAPNTAECIAEASKIFGFPDPHLKEAARNETMWQMQQDLPSGEWLFDALNKVVFAENLDDKILSYMRRHSRMLPPPQASTFELAARLRNQC